LEALDCQLRHHQFDLQKQLDQLGFFCFELRYYRPYDQYQNNIDHRNKQCFHRQL